MVEVGGDIKGLKELAKNSEKLSKSFSRTTLRTALRNAARPVREKARAKVPRDSGDLRRSIAINAKVDRNGEGFADVGYRRDQAFYGGFVELGTSQQQARPFLRPALEESEGDVVPAFIGALNKTIEKVLGKLNG